MAIKSSYIKGRIYRGFTEISNLFELINPLGGIICGGYARYCASPKTKVIPAGDVDIYCSTDEIYENIKSKLESEGFEIYSENDVSVTYNLNNSERWVGTPKVQIIKPMEEARIKTNGEIEEILDNFDFTVTRIAIISPTEVLMDEDFIEHDKTNLLVLKNIHCPISSLFRCIKYIKKGFFMKPSESIKLFDDWNDRNDDYRNTIVNQLKRIEDGDELTEEEIFDLERLMMID